jgi:hypothetical protein
VLVLSAGGTFGKSKAMFLSLTAHRTENLLQCQALLGTPEVEEKIVFQLLPGIDASWRESGIPIYSYVL